MVNGQFTSTKVSSSLNPATFGQSVTFTVVVSGPIMPELFPTGNLPSGTVTFLDGATTLGSAALNGSGQAFFTLSSLSVGTHSITAQYAGNAELCPAFRIW